jgi:hypothetical protein
MAFRLNGHMLVKDAGTAFSHTLAAKLKETRKCRTYLYRRLTIVDFLALHAILITTALVTEDTTANVWRL